ncbi:MAG TPA: hypothetical protein VGJ94_04400 [Syntrophorhabdaceae bacterium]
MKPSSEADRNYFLANDRAFGIDHGPWCSRRQMVTVRSLCLPAPKGGSKTRIFAVELDDAPDFDDKLK